MRRAYKKSYSIPLHVKSRNKGNQSSSRSLVQPAWDDTIHDLNAHKASPEDMLRRKLSRISHNKMGMALLSQRRSTQSGQQARYTPAPASDTEDSVSEAGSTDACTHSRQRSEQQQQHSTAQQQQRPRHQHQAAGSASVRAQYACSSPGSEDEDVCQWQSSPLRHVAPQQQQRALPDASNNPQHSNSWQHQRRQEHAAEGFGNTLVVDADTMQALLDKIGLLEQQLLQQDSLHHEQQSSPDLQTYTGLLQQQLADSQQQLATTRQELHKMQEEHRQYIAHTSTLLTQLQMQVQQLLTGQGDRQLPLQQQQQHTRPLYPSLLGIGGGGAAAAAPAAASDPSSADRLLQISSFIRQQLQNSGGQQQGPQEGSDTAGSRAAAASHASTPELRHDPCAVSGAAVAATAAAVPSSSQSTVQRCQHAAAQSRGDSPPRAGSRRPAWDVSSSSVGSSPARKRGDLLFTPALADTVPLPSYATMQQHSRAVEVAASSWQPDRAAGQQARPQAAANEAGAAGDQAQPWSSSWRAAASSSPRQSAAAPVGSPKRLYTSPVPHPLPAEDTGGLQAQEQAQQPAPLLAQQHRQVHPPLQLLKVSPPEQQATGAAAVWEAELSSPRRSQQLQVPREQVHYHLSNASAESVPQAAAASVAGAGTAPLAADLAALLRDLGLASLELQDAEGQAQQQLGVSSSGSPGKIPQPIQVTATRTAATNATVLSESATASAAALAPQLLHNSRGEGVLAGPQDVDLGLQEGLPRAAVSRIFTAAGCVSDSGADLQPQRVLTGQLRNNMCLRDHLRAAAATAAAAPQGSKGV